MHLEWDRFVQQQHRGHILQMSGYGELKAAYGWQLDRIGITEGGELVAGLQVLSRGYKNSPYRMAYIAPAGPVYQTREQLDCLMAELMLRYQGQVSYVRWEPWIYFDSDTKPDFSKYGFCATEEHIQPPNTIIVDLTTSEDEMLARMNQATRRNIRKSQSNGIEYYVGHRVDVTKFQQAMEATAERKAFTTRDERYHQLAYDLYDRNSSVKLFMAEHEGDVLGGIMVFVCGSVATYLYGASSNIKRELQPNFGLQWMAMCWAKQHGCTMYDLWGIPDAELSVLEEGFKQRSDGLWGV